MEDLSQHFFGKRNTSIAILVDGVCLMKKTYKPRRLL